MQDGGSRTKDNQGFLGRIRIDLFSRIAQVPDQITGVSHTEQDREIGDAP